MSRSGLTSSTVRITSSNRVTSPRTTGAPTGSPPNAGAPGFRSMPTTDWPRASSRRMSRGPMKPVAPITSTDTGPIVTCPRDLVLPTDDARDRHHFARRRARGLRHDLLEQRRAHRAPRRHRPLDHQSLEEPVRGTVPGGGAVDRPRGRRVRAVAPGSAPRGGGVDGAGLHVLHPLARAHLSCGHADPDLHRAVRGRAAGLAAARRARGPRTWLAMGVAVVGAVVMVSGSYARGALAGDLLAIVM